MKTRINKFTPGGLYSLSGNASANSLFFEDSTDQRLFLKLLDRFLGELIDLHAYSTNSTGWNLFFKVKDSASIVEVYTRFKKKSKKAKVSPNVEPCDMLAEHFRYFLSAYVKQSNFRHRCHGSRVHSKMEKYVFGSVEAMNNELAKMRAMKESNVQRSRYRPDRRYYLVEKQLKRDSVLRNSFVGLSGEKLVRAVVPCFRWILDQTDVLRQLILYTWKLHFGSDNPPFLPPQIE